MPAVDAKLFLPSRRLWPNFLISTYHSFLLQRHEGVGWKNSGRKWLAVRYHAGTMWPVEGPLSKAFQFCNKRGCTSAPLKFAIVGRLFQMKTKYKGKKEISSFTKAVDSIAALLVGTSVVLERYQTCQTQSQRLLVCLVSLTFDFRLKVETDVAPFRVRWFRSCCGRDRARCHLCQQ